MKLVHGLCDVVLDGKESGLARFRRFFRGELNLMARDRRAGHERDVTIVCPGGRYRVAKTPRACLAPSKKRRVGGVRGKKNKETGHVLPFPLSPYSFRALRAIQTVHDVHKAACPHEVYRCLDLDIGRLDR